MQSHATARAEGGVGDTFEAAAARRAACRQLVTTRAEEEVPRARALEVLLTVTQFDLAVVSVVAEQCVSVAAVCVLVAEKSFAPARATRLDDEALAPPRL